MSLRIVSSRTSALAFLTGTVPSSRVASARTQRQVGAIERRRERFEAGARGRLLQVDDGSGDAELMHPGPLHLVSSDRRPIRISQQRDCDRCRSVTMRSARRRGACR